MMRLTLIQTSNQKETMSTMTSKKPATKGRPPITPQYLKEMRSTPKGEEVLVGQMPEKNQAFKSYEAAYYHRQQILKASPRAKATIRRVPGAITISVERSSGRTVTTTEDGYYLVLVGRGRKAAA